VPHLQAAYTARYFLDNSTKGQNEADLVKSLDLSSITFEQATQGLALLREWKSDEKVKDEYRSKAASQWSEASVFKE
jgi:N-alpha-acetyltransferase 15/16, NatA auxiliary subunit